MTYLSVRDDALRLTMEVVMAADEFTEADDMFQGTALDACDTDNPVNVRWRKAKEELWRAVQEWRDG